MRPGALSSHAPASSGLVCSCLLPRPPCWGAFGSALNITFRSFLGILFLRADPHSPVSKNSIFIQRGAAARHESLYENSRRYLSYALSSRHKLDEFGRLVVCCSKGIMLEKG